MGRERWMIILDLQSIFGAKIKRNERNLYLEKLKRDPQNGFTAKDQPIPVLAFLHSGSLCALIFIHCLFSLIPDKKQEWKTIIEISMVMIPLFVSLDSDNRQKKDLRRISYMENANILFAAFTLVSVIAGVEDFDDL